MKKTIIAIMIMTLAASVLSQPVSAVGYQFIPYNSYSYNEWNEAVLSMDGYYPQRSFFSDKTGNEQFSQPVDMIIDDYGNFYILNAGTLDIVILDKELNFISRIRNFIMPDGTQINLSEPKGFYYSNDLLYIADSGLQKVLICNLSGSIVRTIEKPDNAMYPIDTFQPQKVLLDNMGNLYVLVQGIYQGALCFDKEDEFIGYYGENKVVATYDVLMQKFWRYFMTEDQIDSTSSIVPVEYTNFDIDKNGFIYTCTATGTKNTDEIRKLNSLGSNILTSKQYGDYQVAFYKDKYYRTTFCDICVNTNGFIFALDSTMGRIFVYDSQGEQAFIFGGNGNQVGCFQSPSAIDTYDSNVYVLDSKKNSITEFGMTEYGRAVEEATVAYSQGKYSESEQLWENVLKQNENYSLAYVGIGKAKYYQGDYKAAMEYFERGSDRAQESTAYKQLRKMTVRKNMTAWLIAILMFIAVIIIIKYQRRTKRER